MPRPIFKPALPLHVDPRVFRARASLKRKLAGHNQSSTTSRYSRGTPEAIARALDATKGE